MQEIQKDMRMMEEEKEQMLQKLAAAKRKVDWTAASLLCLSLLSLE